MLFCSHTVSILFASAAVGKFLWGNAPSILSTFAWSEAGFTLVPGGDRCVQVKWVGEPQPP